VFIVGNPPDHSAGNRPAAGDPSSRNGTAGLEQSVLHSLETYFANLDGAKPHALHEMVLGAIERPLLKFAMQRCDGNQSAAADLLGINRNTLRRKLNDYGLH
jgi:Fis family transcriptional regulator